MNNRDKTILLFIGDFLILFLSLLIVTALEHNGGDFDLDLRNHFSLFIYIFPVWQLTYLIEGLYSLETYNPSNLPISLLRGTIISVLVSFIIFYFIPEDISNLNPKTNLLIMGLLSAPTLLWWRRFFLNFFSNDNRLRETIIIGSQKTIELTETELSYKPYLGYGIIAALTPEEATDFDTTLKVRMVAIERNIIKTPSLYQYYFSMLGSGVEIVDLAKFTEEISGKIPLSSIDESWFVEYCGRTSNSYEIAKSLFDRTVALLLLLIVVPFFIVLLPILLIFHGKPIFFKQVRTGLNNKPFTLYKLRTMVVDAEKHGAQWARPKDARVTRIGKFLRKTRLDELPQLINILKGEMSIVGPRPERPEIINNSLAPNIPFYNLRHLVKPGVTGWAQVQFRYGFSQEDSATKLQYDLYYVKNKNLWLDLIIILKTIKTVITGAGQ